MNKQLNDKASDIIKKMKRGSSTIQWAEVVTLIDDLVRYANSASASLLSSDKCRECIAGERIKHEVNVWSAWREECLELRMDIYGDIEDVFHEISIRGETASRTAHIQFLEERQSEVLRFELFAVDMMMRLRGAKE